MRIRWSADAAEDLDGIHKRLREDNPEAAHRIVRTIYDGCMSLKTFPARGRVGLEPGSRELVFAPPPWIAVYRTPDETVEISRIWHAARDRQQ